MHAEKVIFELTTETDVTGFYYECDFPQRWGLS